MDSFKTQVIVAQAQKPLRENCSRLPSDPLADGYARNLIDKYRSLIVWRPEGSGPVEAAAVPTEHERMALISRDETLERILLPASTTTNDVARVAAAVSSMLGGGYSSLQNVDRRATIAGYTEAMQDLPAWAVERGCAAVRAGKVDGLNPDWPPTHARLHQISEKELAPVIAERAQIRSVLALQLPPQPDEAAAARMNAAAKSWLDRSDPVAQRLIEGTDEAPASREAAERSREALINGSKDEIRKEWESAGLEPQPYSLELAKLLHPKPTAEGQGEAA